ncbi:MAG: flagellar type III secretion system pore protein FliP [Thermodesulfovibrionales bacterium]|nr:flagellar type III secretion system pore protein FliP [Thermodesulfovibrionales bacterium]
MKITDPAIEVFFLVGALSLLPSILVSFTSFTRIVVVMSILRQALGSPNLPPNSVIIGISLFLTFYIMGPTLDSVTRNALMPYIKKEISIDQALKKAEPDIKAFMLRQTREKDLALFVKLSKQEIPSRPEELSLRIVVPAFVISELSTAFKIGFLIYLPFLVIDMVVSSILLSMGMMMLPPVLVSMPFKLLLFVMVDGWNLIAGSLVRSFQ